MAPSVGVHDDPVLRLLLHCIKAARMSSALAHRSRSQSRSQAGDKSFCGAVRRVGRGLDMILSGTFSRLVDVNMSLEVCQALGPQESLAARRQHVAAVVAFVHTDEEFAIRRPYRGRTFGG